MLTTAARTRSETRTKARCMSSVAETGPALEPTGGGRSQGMPANRSPSPRPKPAVRASSKPTPTLARMRVTGPPAPEYP